METNNQSARILVVEDEDSLAIGLEFNLNQEGYQTTRASDGKQALKRIEEHTYDLIILDVMLPYFDGFEIAKRVRVQHPQIPILMLTARTSSKDRIKGLESGADDYLVKPFHLKELLLRVQGMLKRKQWYQDVSVVHPIIQFGENEINFENLKARHGQNTFILTAREAMIMKYLIQNKNKVVSRKELLENVWQTNKEIETRTIDNFIMRLRKYFEVNPSKPVFIVSVRSIGYMFNDLI